MSNPVAGRRSPVAGLLILFLGCGAQTHTSPPNPANGDRRPATEPTVIFPDNTRIRVELATDDATREQGLMYRDQLAAGRGMIFVFPTVGNYPFWMKNTLIPLDMIWIDDQKRIVSIAHDVPPCKADPCASYDPRAFARYVLEVAAGVAHRHGLANGQTLRFEAMDNVVVR